jgi:hypothetical protein
VAPPFRSDRSDDDIIRQVLAVTVQRAMTRLAGCPSKTIMAPSWPVPGVMIQSAGAMTVGNAKAQVTRPGNLAGADGRG